MKIKEGDITLELDETKAPVEVCILFRNNPCFTLGETGIAQLYNALNKLLKIAQENANKTATKQEDAGER